MNSSEYDSELKMFRDKPQELDYGKLRFIKWLVEHGKIGPAENPISYNPTRALEDSLRPGKSKIESQEGLKI